MKKLLLALTVVLALTAAHGQTGKYDSLRYSVEAIIDWKYNGTINIYDKPDGKIIDSIKNDSTNEDYLQLTIFDETENYFYVSISRQKAGKRGWIKKANYIGAYAKAGQAHNKKSPIDLTIYQDKKVSDTGKVVIKDYKSELLTIEKYTNKWAFISLTRNGETYKGWIETDKLCANSYTYCN